MKRAIWIYISVCFFCLTFAVSGFTQVLDFDPTSEGPWSDIPTTSITVPKVSDGSITLDASISASEYGGFAGISVVPGENAWILDFQEAPSFEGPQDTSFTFYVAYDNDNLYIGVEAMDDAVVSDDVNSRFWADDAIELVWGVNPQMYDYNTDSVPQDIGGHSYVNYAGRFSEWLDDIGPADLRRFSLAVEWEYGEDAEVYGFGQETANGWTMECRFDKSLIEQPDNGAPFTEGSTFKFNIGMDDDDGEGLALQYFWANRVRAIDFNPDNEWYDLLLDDEIANMDYLDPESDAAFWEIGVNSNGRLSTAGAGDMTLGPPAAKVADWSVH